MKLTPEDNLKFSTALAVCKLADIDLAAISEGLIRGMSESRSAIIISPLHLSIDPGIQLGITRLSELEKRFSLFGTDVTVEGEVTEAKKVRKLSIKGKTGKIEFRCTDVAMIDKKYPKAMNDSEGAVLSLSKAEVALLVRGTKMLGAEQVTIQIKRDGAVHIESVDSSSDRFEIDLSKPAEFVSDSYGSVFSYNTSSTGVFLSLLDHSVREKENTDLIMMKSGNIGIDVLGHQVLAIPRIII